MRSIEKDLAALQASVARLKEAHTAWEEEMANPTPGDNKKLAINYEIALSDLFDTLDSHATVPESLHGLYQTDATVHEVIDLGHVRGWSSEQTLEQLVIELAREKADLRTALIDRIKKEG